MRKMSSLLLATLLSSVAACREQASVKDAALPKSALEKPVERGVEPSEPPPSDVNSAVSDAAVVKRKPLDSKVKAPARGCALADDQLLRSDAVQAWAAGEYALVLRADRQTLELWSVAGTPFEQLAAEKLDAAVSELQPLASTALAWVDQRGDVWLQRIEGGHFGKRLRVAQQADRRFAPALATVGDRLLIAFTRTVENAMHTFVSSLVASKLETPADVTPQGHGAASPSFVVGTAAPSLVFMDARAGVSPLLEVPFDTQGKAQPAIVRTPVSQPYTPPLLRAVVLPPSNEVEVAFTAVGKLAATAIGRVPLRKPVAPIALHPSRGYGQLSMSVALLKQAALFALEVPTSEEAKAPRQIELKWLDDQGEGETLVIKAGQGSARFPHLSVGADVSLVYSNDDGVHHARLSCDG